MAAAQNSTRRLARALERAAGPGLAALAGLSDEQIDALAREMATLLPAERPHPYRDQVGPCYTTAVVATLLGLSRQAVHGRAGRGTLLAVRTSDGHALFPTFQFTDDRQVLPGLKQALAPFHRAGIDAWAVADWLTTPAAALGGTTPAHWLHQGQPSGPVAAAAGTAAARWSAVAARSAESTPTRQRTNSRAADASPLGAVGGAWPETREISRRIES